MTLTRKLYLPWIDHVWLIPDQLYNVSIGPDIYLVDQISAFLHLNMYGHKSDSHESSQHSHPQLPH